MDPGFLRRDEIAPRTGEFGSGEQESATVPSYDLWVEGRRRSCAGLRVVSSRFSATRAAGGTAKQS